MSEITLQHAGLARLKDAECGPRHSRNIFLLYLSYIHPFEAAAQLDFQKVLLDLFVSVHLKRIETYNLKQLYNT